MSPGSPGADGSPPIVWPVWGILQDAALALEDRGHNLTLRGQLYKLETPPRAVCFDTLINVSPPFGYQCSSVFEHGSWERFGDTWRTGLPRLMPVDDLPADATDDADDDDEDVVWDEVEGFSDKPVDDESDSATEDDDDDDDEDDVPVMSDEEEVEECWPRRDSIKTSHNQNPCCIAKNICIAPLIGPLCPLCHGLSR